MESTGAATVGAACRLKKKKRNQKFSTEKIRLGWNDVTGGVGRGKGNSLKVSQGCFLALHDGILAKAPDSILGKMAGAALPSLCPLAPSEFALSGWDLKSGYRVEDPVRPRLVVSGLQLLTAELGMIKKIYRD